MKNGIKFKTGDRVTYHGDKTKWRGMGGTVRFVDEHARFALVVPDQGLPDGFDIRWSLVDLHRERKNER